MDVAPVSKYQMTLTFKEEELSQNWVNPREM